MAWKKEFTPEEKAKWAAEQEEKLKNAEQMLSDGVKEIYTSEKYADYLRFYSGFHQYSFCNSLLIMLQKPDASHCASYADWKKKGRSVRKGEKGIVIRVPTPKKFKVEDPKTGEEKEVSKMFYKLGTTFDISQTEGKEIPEICSQLKASVSNYTDILDHIRKASPVKIDFEDMEHSHANVYYSVAENRIVVRNNMSESQSIKTAVHETAHALLHGKGKAEEKADRDLKELQAESVAYIVCNFLGIDTSDYSFGYVAGWAADKTAKKLEKNLTVISDTAKVILKSFE